MSATVAAVSEPGGYFSLGKIIGVFVLMVPWFYAAAWAGKDAAAVPRINRSTWTLLLVGAGAVGFALWLAVPIYAVGLVMFVLPTGGSLLGYVKVRNGRVPAHRRVLTGQQLSSLFGGGHTRDQVARVLNKVKIYGANGRVVLPPEATGPPDRVAAYNLAQELLYQIVWRRASDADLAVDESGSARLLLVIDGVVARRSGWDPGETETVIQFIKEHAGMDVAERRRPQQGRITAEMDGKRADMVVTSKGTTTGQRIQFRVEQETVKTDLDELGMAPGQLARMRIILSESGVVIVSGPRGSGVTSTLYSLLRDFDAFTKLLVSLERNPAIDLENVDQVTYGDPAERAGKLNALLRRDPDVLGVDACSERETAQVIAQAAENKTVLLAMQAASTFTALAKWVKVSEDAAVAMQNLRAVLCQILLRRLCPSCKEAYRPKADLLAKANIKAENVEYFYRPPSEPQRDSKGNPIVCPTCQGSGYCGRTAAYEMLEVTDEVRQLVLTGATVSKIKAECRKARMLYLQERALQKVLDGETSIQEVIRVTQGDEKK
ncbi:MAG: Flp pilus assembly complex ATPase component TadA [Phycisphaerae bacterium]|nr:Flp pilus assembly complex ATPase component TadA [Phycisphaerae bacterium]